MRPFLPPASSWKSRRLSVRLLVYVGCCSLLFILLAIALQLYTEYQRDLAGIETRFGFIESSYVPALTASAYQLDETQMRLQLRGILQLQDIVYARVREQLNAQIYDVGEGDAEARGAIIREFPLQYQAQELVPVGNLVVGASLDGVYMRLRERALTIVVTNALLIVPLALSILLIFQLALNRHLVKMAQFAGQLNLDTLDQALTLQRVPSQAESRDELDQLVGSINEMRIRLKDDMQLRREAQQQLLFQKALLECVLEASMDGFLITSETEKCLYLNRHFFALWQFPADIVPGSSSQAVFAHIEQQLQDHSSFANMMQALREGADGIVQGEVVLLSAAVYEYYSVPVQNSEGLHYGRLWSFRDVTQRKTLEAQLRQARKLETIGSLAGGIAHDFNNMLAPIIGYAELGLSRLSPDGIPDAHYGLILKAAVRAADLTRQILAFSRKQVLEVSIIDLNELLRDFQSMIQRLIGETIVVQTMLAPQPALIRVDKSQIEQVVLNVAINARDAMPDGGTLTIETARIFLDQSYAQRHADVEVGEYVMLSISDTGVGIDAAVRERIFEPFFTTKEHGKGTGLGLATSFGIIKQHHGHIWVYSEPGHGTTFKIYLPRAEGTPLPLNPEVVDALVLQGSEQILVVEDDAMVRELVCETLVAHGYKVIEADSPAVALDRAARMVSVDLLLTDVVMPGMNGRELHRLLTSRIPDLKVLYMSGYTENVIADQGMLYEGVDFIQKPFSVPVFLSKVRQVLG